MDSEEFVIPQSTDLWAYLPFDAACNIISKLTDIFDIYRAI